MGAFLCDDCKYETPSFPWSHEATSYVEAQHCYGKNDWRGPKGLIGGGKWCICTCVAKQKCQKCQGKCSWPPFTRQVCDMCNGSGKYQKRPEDIEAEEFEKWLLEHFDRIGKYIQCKTCAVTLAEEEAAERHYKWHEKLKTAITLTGPWTELGRRNLRV